MVVLPQPLEEGVAALHAAVLGAGDELQAAVVLAAEEGREEGGEAQRQLPHVLPPLLYQLPVHPVRVPQRPGGQRGAQVPPGPAGLQQPVQLPQLADLLGRRVAGAVADEADQLHRRAGLFQQLRVAPRRLGVPQQRGVGILVASLGAEVGAERRDRGVLRLQEGAARERREQSHRQDGGGRRGSPAQAAGTAEHGAAGWRGAVDGRQPLTSGSGGQGAGLGVASVGAPRGTLLAVDPGRRRGAAGNRVDLSSRETEENPRSSGHLRFGRRRRRGPRAWASVLVAGASGTDATTPPLAEGSKANKPGLSLGLPGHL